MPRQAASPMPITAPRRSTNVTLPEKLLREAREININVSQACEQGLGAAVQAAKTLRWQQKNRDAIAEWNAYVDRHGLPLAAFRAF